MTECCADINRGDHLGSEMSAHRGVDRRSRLDHLGWILGEGGAPVPGRFRLAGAALLTAASSSI